LMMMRSCSGRIFIVGTLLYTKQLKEMALKNLLALYYKECQS
jgi:hypothetical protein